MTSNADQEKAHPRSTSLTRQSQVFRARALALALLAGGMNKAGIAAAIGYNRTSISRWLNEPDYNGEHLAAAVLLHFDLVACPALKREITPAACRGYALRACPTASVREARHWRTCQTCKHKPEVKA